MQHNSKSVTLARVTLPALLLAVCTVMHALARAHPLLMAQGLPALAQNLLGIPLLILFSASCYALGAGLLPTTGLRSRLDIFLLRTITGYCLFSVLGYALGLLKMLTPSVSMAVLALPLVFFPRDSVSRPTLNRRQWAMLALAAAIGLWLLCLSGFLHDYVENDFAHYYSTIRLSLERGDLLPNVYFLAHFYIKGFGAPFLLMAATSEYTVTLATFFALFVLALLTYRLAAMMTGNTMAALAAALLLLASKAVRIESYKMHCTVSMLLLACPYFMARLQLGPASLRPRLGLLLALLLSATVVALPPSAIFMAPPLLLLLALGLFTPKVLPLRRAVLIAAAPTATFVAMIALNYTLTGIPEVTPLYFFGKYMDFARADSWIPATVLKFELINNRGSDGYAFSAAKVGAFLAKAGVGIALAALLHRVLRASHPLLLRRLWVTLLPVLALGALCPVLERAAAQTSFKRLIVFYSPVQMLAFSAILLAVLTAGHAWLSRRSLVRIPRRRVVTALFTLAALYALIFNWTPKLPQQAIATRAYFGISPLATVFTHWRKAWQVVEELDAMQPDKPLVMLLQFAPYASMYDSKRFLRPLDNEHVRELPLMLGADPDAAADAYLRAGIRYFLVDLTPTKSPYYVLCFEGYGSVFDTESVARRFRVRQLSGNNWLLILRGGDADGAVPGADFLALFAARKAQDQACTDNRFRDGLAVARRELPELALPTPGTNVINTN